MGKRVKVEDLKRFDEVEDTKRFEYDAQIRIERECEQRTRMRTRVNTQLLPPTRYHPTRLQAADQ